MALPDFKDYRFDPFDEVFYPKQFIEQQNIIFDESTQRHGVRTNEGIQLVTPISSVSIVEDATGGITFTEVGRNTPPSTGEYRVDYLADLYHGTSFIEFNAADTGKDILVTYDGLGTNVKGRYTLTQATVVPTSLGVEGSIQVTDNVVIETDPTLKEHVGTRGYNDIRYAGQIDFQEDSDFAKGMWSLPTGVSIVDDSSNGGTLTTIKLDGTISPESFYEVANSKYFIPIKNDLDSIWSDISVRADGAFDGDAEVIVSLYDKDKTFLAHSVFTIPNAQLLIVYKAFCFQHNAVSNAEFFLLKIRASPTASAGNIFVKNIRNSLSPIAQAESLNNYSTINSIDRYLYASNTKSIGGLTFIPALDQNYLSMIQATTNYDVYGTNFYKDKAKLALLEIRTPFQGAQSGGGSDLIDSRVSAVMPGIPGGDEIVDGFQIRVVATVIGFEHIRQLILPIYGHNLNANGFSNIRMNDIADAGTPNEIKFLGFWI